MTTHHHKTAPVPQSASVQPPGEPKAAVAPELEGQAPKARLACEETVRIRAYQKWETAGKPHGNGVQFWLEAERELGNGR